MLGYGCRFFLVLDRCSHTPDERLFLRRVELRMQCSGNRSNLRWLQPLKTVRLWNFRKYAVVSAGEAGKTEDSERTSGRRDRIGKTSGQSKPPRAH